MDPGMWMAMADVAKELLMGQAGPAAPQMANAGMNNLGIGSSGASGQAMSQTAQSTGGSDLASSLSAVSGPVAQLSQASASPAMADVAPADQPVVPPPPTATGQGFNQGAAVQPSAMDAFAATEPDDPKNTPHNRTLAEVAGSSEMIPIDAPGSDTLEAIAADPVTTTPTAEAGTGMDPMEMAAIGASLMSGIMAQPGAPPPPGLPHMQGPGLVPMSRRRR